MKAGNMPFTYIKRKKKKQKAIPKKYNPKRFIKTAVTKTSTKLALHNQST